MATAQVIPLLTFPQPQRAIPRARIHRVTRAYLTPAELLAVLKIARAKSTRDWCMILVAYRHGLRASEVCGLKLADLDLRTGSITLRRLKGSMHQTQPLYSHRGQPLLDETAALRAWLRDRVEDGSGFLFLSQKGGAMHRSSFFSLFCAIATAAGLPEGKRNPHVLKHSLASHLVAGNVNPVLIKQCLGHRSIGSTMQYVHANDSQAAAACSAALMGLF